MSPNITHDYQFLMSPQNDLTFKILFGTEKNNNLLSSLIRSLTGEWFGEITIQNPFLLRNYPLEKEGILDIKVKTEQNYQIFIEMQRSRLLSIPERMLFYWAKAHASQEIKGKDYFSLKRTIGICILGFPLYLHEDAVSCYQTLERSEHERLCENLDLYFFQLGDTIYSERQKLSRDVWAWRLFLGAKTEEEMIMAAEASEAVNEAYESLKIISQNKEIRAIYDAREQFLLDQATREREAKEEGKSIGIEEGKSIGIEEGKSIGIEEGKSIGIEEGKSIGIEEGKTEAMETIAKNLIMLGMDDALIEKATGLSLEMIGHIRSRY